MLAKQGKVLPLERYVSQGKVKEIGVATIWMLPIVTETQGERDNAAAACLEMK